jgi:hypothetical protein
MSRGASSAMAVSSSGPDTTAGTRLGALLPPSFFGRRPPPGAGGVFSRPELVGAVVGSSGDDPCTPHGATTGAPSSCGGSAPAPRVSYSCSFGWVGLELARSTPMRACHAGSRASLPREDSAYSGSVVVSSTWENGTLRRYVAWGGDGGAIGGR